MGLGSAITLSWIADFGTYDYENVPVNVYLAAIRDPKVTDAPSSVADVLAGGGEIYLAADRMSSWYRYVGRVREPTFSGVSFPPVAMSGSITKTSPTRSGFSGDWVFATAFIRLDTGGFVRTDGMPVENSNKIIRQE